MVSMENVTSPEDHVAVYEDVEVDLTDVNSSLPVDHCNVSLQ